MFLLAAILDLFFDADPSRCTALAFEMAEVDFDRITDLIEADAAEDAAAFGYDYNESLAYKASHEFDLPSDEEIDNDLVSTQRR